MWTLKQKIKQLDSDRSVDVSESPKLEKGLPMGLGTDTELSTKSQFSLLSKSRININYIIRFSWAVNDVFPIKH